MDLFSQQVEANIEQNLPLAARMRPRKLDEFVGQQHFIGPGKLLRRILASRRLGSVLFAGPPGTGKTTLAHLLAIETGGKLRELSAVASGVKELREALAWARDEIAAGAPRPLLFVDEIHRFNRAQQDALLPDVEQGIVSLIGATTSNPYFAVNGALLSRSQVFQFQPLSNAEIVGLLKRAISDRERGFGLRKIEVDDETLDYLARNAEGDARRALSVLEVAVLSSATETAQVQLSVQAVADSMQQKILQYDGTGDEHYDITSALIKSIRGSDPNAAMYWLARMLEAGEEIRFICRRLVILASEDIGNADPQALVVAVSAFQACEFVGLPECQLTLSQAVLYLSCAPKSNAATRAIGAARDAVQQGKLLPVPLHLRDSHYPGASNLGNGKGYLYPHDFPEGFVKQDYLGAELQLFEPSPRGWESGAYAELQRVKKRKDSAKE